MSHIETRCDWSAQTTRSPHANRAWSKPVDEWAVASLVDCGMHVKSVLENLHVGLELLLSHNRSRNYDYNCGDVNSFS